MPGCRSVLVAAALTTAVLAGTTGTAVADEADSQTVFSFADGRITESSGLADAGRLMFTTNDSGDGPLLYVVDKTTGDTVGVTTYSSEGVSDVEAIAPGRDGSVWVGDIGDNDMNRPSVDLYEVPRPRLGDRQVDAERLRLVYPDTAHDAEALLVHPRTGRVYVVSKAILGGIVFAAPQSLESGSVNRLSVVGHVPDLVTDGAFFPDGEHILLRSYGSARVYTFPGLRVVATIELPRQEQGEGVAISRSGRVYICTEGAFSDVTRVVLPAGLRRLNDNPPEARPDDADDDEDPKSGTTGEQPSTTSDASSTSAGDEVRVVGAVVGVAAIGWFVLRASRRRSRRTR